MTVVHRFRLFAAGFALIFSLGVVCVGASAATSARISAHLTSTSFTAAQAGSVKVQYKFSSKSSGFAYVLSRKASSRWSTVRSVSKRGSFRGSHTMTVKSVFTSKPITAGHYRLKLSSSANSFTLSFTIVSPPATPTRPQPGSWVATVSGPVYGSDAGGDFTVTGVFFTVAPGQTAVSTFGFSYNYEDLYPCTSAGSVTSSESTPSPITNNKFSTPGESGPWTRSVTGTFNGTFDSATTAHGTAYATGSFGGPSPCFAGYAETGTFTWTATWRGS